MSAKQKAVALAALDALGLALVDTGHRWTNEQRRLYERAVKVLRS